MSESSKRLRIAYAIQNVGGIDFAADIGDTVPVKQTLLGLTDLGHDVSCFRLHSRSVVGIDDVSTPHDVWPVSLGISGTRPFKLIESGVRRLQRNLSLPYFAIFDSYRFYEACMRTLPRFTLCHEHNGLFCVGASLACRRLGIPYVLTFSADPLFELELVGKPLRGLHAWLAAWAAKLTYRMARKIICVSEPAKQHLIENWRVDPGKIVVMPNGVDVSLFAADHDSEAARTMLELGSAPVVGFVGGIQPWHGLDGLVESMVHILAEVPQAKLLLVGDGPARPTVEQKIADLGLESSVIITGFVAQNRVPEFLAAVDVAVAPYPQLPQELWFSPLKLYEYMAAGKAIVASRSGQIAEVIRDGYNGLLVRPGDRDDLARTVSRLLNDLGARKRLGGNAQRQAIEQHSWERYVERLEEVYFSTLDN